ncbi:hypothetical protein CH063_06130 [Colletotrichum higginsianum]|uniref:Uncharacterized protein n=2 Tax=Colletotrichum higginsianum TaxID=80884 RepID=H1V1F4_COLHI|nr:hypothetical protein CH063_06130 [Colletotrichum higginsianum]
MVDAARYAKVELSYGLEVHPETSKEDPILLTSIGVDGKKCPPSQDPEILRYLQQPS